MVDVSTVISTHYGETGCRPYDSVPGLESGPDLLAPERLGERLAVLDEVDAVLGHATELPACAGSGRIGRLRALRKRLEAANRELYEEARADIRAGHSRRLRQWLVDEPGSGASRAGLSFDIRDEIVSGVLHLPEPEEPEVAMSAEMLAYQPTPARHIVDLIAAGRLSQDDVLVDLGSGLGHVPLLVSMLCGIRTLGVELQPAYVACAREYAQKLGVRQARFVANDARVADLTSGSVFYLFTPFTGSVLREVLERLREESTRRQIRVCSLGPCTRELQSHEWLRASARPETGRIAVFASQ